MATAVNNNSLIPADRVILVAHSFGGLAISQAMEMYPEKIAVAVFVSALMPSPHLNVSTLNKEVNSSSSSVNFKKRILIMNCHVAVVD